MREYSGIYSMRIMARVLNVSRSGFYLWCNSSGRNFRDERKQAIDERVKSVFEDSKCRDGADRIFVELTEKGTPHNIKTIRKSLKDGILCQRRPGYLKSPLTAITLCR